MTSIAPDCTPAVPPLPPGIDGRTKWARRLRFWAERYARAPNAAARPDLVSAAASLTVAREQLDQRVACGDLPNPHLLTRLVNATARVTSALGLDSAAPFDASDFQDVAAMLAQLRRG